MIQHSSRRPSWRLAALLGLALLTPSAALAGKKDKVKKSKNKDAPVQVEQAPEPQPTAAPVYEPLPQPAWAKDSPPSGEVTVRLLEAGAEPRATLRLSPVVGKKETMTMTMDMDMGMTMMGMSLPSMGVPTQVYVFDVETMAVKDSGDFTSRMVLQDVRLEGEDELGIGAQLEPELRSMVGMVGTTEMNSRGVALSSSFEAPAGMTADAKAQLDSLEQQASTLSLPFPEEAVGAGAKWEVLRTRDNQGMTFLERLVVTYVDQQDGRLLLETATEQALLEDGNTMEGLPDGAEVHFTAFESGGTGMSMVRLDSISPDEGMARMALRMAMAITVEGMTQEMSMDFALDLAVKGGPAE